MRQSFYEASAQVLPILILVVAVGELRWRAQSDRGELYFSLLTMAAMVLGEFFSLAVLASGKDSGLEAAVVVIGIALGCLHLFVEFAAILLKEALAGEEDSRGAEFLVRAVFTFVALVILVGVAVLYLPFA